MLKYNTTKIVFAEIPDEISLAISVTGCPNRCPNCHSPELREGFGNNIKDDIFKLINENPYITCVLFLGGDASHDEIYELTKLIKSKTDLKVAFYSGNNNRTEKLFDVLDYYKIGSYQEKYGPLNCKTTNQRLYMIREGEIEDITFKFWITHVYG